MAMSKRAPTSKPAGQRKQSGETKGYSQPEVWFAENHISAAERIDLNDADRDAERLLDQLDQMVRKGYSVSWKPNYGHGGGIICSFTTYLLDDDHPNKGGVLTGRGRTIQGAFLSALWVHKRTDELWVKPGEKDEDWLID